MFEIDADTAAYIRQGPGAVTISFKLETAGGS